MNETSKKKPPSVELKGPSTTHRINQMTGTFLHECLVSVFFIKVPFKAL